MAIKKKLKMTTIQLSEKTKIVLDRKKVNKRESYDSVINKLLENTNLPSIEEMFTIGDKIKEKKEYSTEEIIKISHELRKKK